MDQGHYTTPVKRPVLAVKFYFGGYDPEKAFELLTADSVPLEAKATDTLLCEWQPARAGATLAAVRDYMLDNDLAVLSTERIGQRRNGGWQGLYVVKIGKETRQ